MEILKQNNRISISVRPKGGKWEVDFISLSMDIPEKTSPWDFADTMRAELMEYAEKTAPQQRQNSFAENAPSCPLCNAEMKKSKSGYKWVCTNAKWKQDNGQWTNSGCQGMKDA